MSTVNLNFLFPHFCSNYGLFKGMMEDHMSKSHCHWTGQADGTNQEEQQPDINWSSCCWWNYTGLATRCTIEVTQDCQTFPS